MSTTTALSLYKLDLELLALIQAREDIATDPDLTPQEAEAALKAVDQQIAEYLPQALANRADEVANILRQWEAMGAADKDEMLRLKERRDRRDEAIKYLEARVLELMERAEKKTIEGQHVTLKRMKNPASVEVAQPDMVPSAYQRVTVKLTLDLWTRLTARVMTTEKKGDEMLAEVLDAKVSTPEPILSHIGNELKAGVGVPGCRLANENFRLEIK